MKWIKRADGQDICENCEIERYVVEDVYFDKNIEELDGKGVLEITIHPSGSKPTIRINVGADEPVLIDKLFGPLCAEQIRIYLNLDSHEWVVERQRIDQAKDGNDICSWEKKISWFCQEGINFRDEE